MLARDGIVPEILERTKSEHDCVCGGFLSADTLESLRALGLDPARLGARPIRRLRLVSGRSEEIVALPFEAAALSRRTLDCVLLEAAAEAGATLRRGITARTAYPGSRAVRTNDDDLILCEALFIATGKHDLRGAARCGTRAHDASIGLRADLPWSARRDDALS
jgi:flavin-dependent dehydrogenase